MNNKIEKFLGWPFYQVNLPDEERIICLYCKDGTEPDLLLYDSNHNIFRLDKTGKIIWQVQRDEQGKVNWEAAHEIERARGKDGERRPFGELHVMTDQGESTHSKTWLPGLVLRALSNGIYEVDIETGIAKNVTPTPWKNW